MSNNIKNCFKIIGNNIIIKVRIITNSSQNRIIGVYNDSLKIAITASPVEGKANKKFIIFLIILLCVINPFITSIFMLSFCNILYKNKEFCNW